MDPASHQLHHNHDSNHNHIATPISISVSAGLLVRYFVTPSGIFGHDYWCHIYRLDDDLNAYPVTPTEFSHETSNSLPVFVIDNVVYCFDSEGTLYYNTLDDLCEIQSVYSRIEDLWYDLQTKYLDDSSGQPPDKHPIEYFLSVGAEDVAEMYRPTLHADLTFEVPLDNLARENIAPLFPPTTGLTHEPNVSPIEDTLPQSEQNSVFNDAPASAVHYPTFEGGLTKENIDAYVNSLKKQRALQRGKGPNTTLKCPLMNCAIPQRRPHALQLSNVENV